MGTPSTCRFPPVIDGFALVAEIQSAVTDDRDLRDLAIIRTPIRVKAELRPQHATLNRKREATLDLLNHPLQVRIDVAC